MPTSTPASHSAKRWNWSSRSRPRERSHRSSTWSRSADTAEAAASSAAVRNTGMTTVRISSVPVPTVIGRSISAPSHARKPVIANAISDTP